MDAFDDDDDDLYEETSKHPTKPCSVKFVAVLVAVVLSIAIIAYFTA